MQKGALLQLTGEAAKVEFGGALTLIHNSTEDKLVCSGKIQASDVVIEGTETTVADLIGEVATLREDMAAVKQFVGMMPPPASPPPAVPPPSLPPSPPIFNSSLAMGDFTIYAEVYADTPADGNYKPVVALQTNQQTPRNWYAGFNLQVQINGNINYFMGAGDSQQYGVSLNGGVLPTSTWTALQVNVRGTSVSLFVDGSLTGSGTFIGQRQTSSSTYIYVGQYDNDGDSENGYVQTSMDMGIRNVSVVPY